MNQIKTGAVLSYVSLGINIVIGLVYTPWMIHSIGRDDYGLYTLAMSIISLFVFDFGLSSAVSRFIAKFIAEDSVEKIKGFMGIVCRMYLSIGSVLALVLIGVYFFIPEIYEKLSAKEISQFKVIYVIASVFSVISFPFIPLNGILSANEKFIQLKLCELAHKLIIVGTMSICLLAGFGLYALVSVNVIAGLAMIVLKLYCVRRYTSTVIDWHYSNKRETREILGFSGWTTVISITQRCVFNLAPSIVGIFSGSASIAILGVAITIEGYTYTFANALNGLFLPKVSKLMARENEDLTPLMIRVGRIQVFIIGTIVICFVCLGQQFINLWVGKSFSEVYICAVLLILPSFLHLPQEIGSTGIVVANKVQFQAIVFIIMAVVNLALAAVFVKILGAVGMCLSISIAYLVRTIGMNYIFKRHLSVNLTNFYINTFVYLLPALAVCTLVGWFGIRIIPLENWGGFILKGILMILMMAIMYWFAGCNAEEKGLIKKLIHK